MPSRGSPNSALHTLHTLSTAHGTARHRLEQGGRHRLECLVVINRNARSPSPGARTPTNCGGVCDREMDNLFTVYFASFVDAPNATENGANLMNDAFGNWV
jgi:hypothetical protein